MQEASDDSKSAPLLGGMPPERGAKTDPEVLARATRRRFTAEYKADIVRRAEACTKPGDLGALLRSEGLYFSHLTTWRKQVREHGVAGLRKRRGPAPKPKPSAREIELERKTRKLEKRLAKAEAIIAFQKKVHELLGIPLNSPEIEGDD